MNECKKFSDLHDTWKVSAFNIIHERMCGKSHIADISIEESDLSFYEFKVTVCKYNSVKGWATIGYLRSVYSTTGSKWRLSFKPKKGRNEKAFAGRTGSYG